MSLTNPNKIVTEQRLKDFYDGILPYLGGTAEAGFTPVGTVISVMGKTAPANYLACNGQIVNIADYPELATYFEEQFESVNYFGGDGTTTFGIVDLSGEFLRGAGTNSHSGEGNGADVGEHQNATRVPNIGTTHGGTDSTKAYGLFYRCPPSSINSDMNYVSNEDANFYPSQTPKKIVFNQDSALDGTSENYAMKSVRPTNTSVLFCIATKNIYLNPSLDYSTDEKVVGTWIDGKTIYQKTFYDTLPTITTDGTAGSKYVDVTALNIEYATKIEGFTPTNGITVNTAWNAQGNTYNLRCSFDKADGNRLVITCDRVTFSEIPVYITIQYTKTSD